MAQEVLMELTSILSQSTVHATNGSLTAAAEGSGHAAKNASTGDTVSISEEGRALAMVMQNSDAASSASEDSEEESSNSTAETLRKKIEQLKREIEEIEQSEMSDEEKERKLAALRTTLTQIQLEYAQALEKENGSQSTTLLSALGSSAEGFGDSLT